MTSAVSTLERGERDGNLYACFSSVENALNASRINVKAEGEGGRGVARRHTVARLNG